MQQPHDDDNDDDDDDDENNNNGTTARRARVHVILMMRMMMRTMRMMRIMMMRIMIMRMRRSTEHDYSEIINKAETNEAAETVPPFCTITNANKWQSIIEKCDHANACEMLTRIPIQFGPEETDLKGVYAKALETYAKALETYAEKLAITSYCPSKMSRNGCGITKRRIDSS
jgi:effector-binding domain-containing protein